jgi:hypothetical protein
MFIFCITIKNTNVLIEEMILLDLTKSSSLEKKGKHYIDGVLISMIRL